MNTGPDPLSAAGAHAPIPRVRPLRRALARAPLLALGRGGALAGAAWIASGAPAPGPTFVATWTVAFAAALALLALLEQPLWEALGARLGSRPRAAAFGATLSLAQLAGLAWLWSPLRSLGGWGPLGVAAAGGLVGALLPPRGATRPRLAWVSAALLVALATALAGVDPEGRYRTRYAENRLGPAELAAPPPFPGRDPATLSDLEVAEALAHTWMRTHPAARLRWSWEEAVALEGLLAYGRASGDPAPAAYAREWVEAHGAAALSEPLWADAAAPAATALVVAGALHPAVDRVARYVREDAPRTRRGALSHTGLLGGGLLPPQAWVDSLFMHGVFLHRLARTPGGEWAAEEALRLGRAAVAALQDEVSGLFRHAEVEVGPLAVRLPVEPLFWARGNGWAAWFLVDALETRRALGLPLDPTLGAALDRLAAAVLGAQDEGGLWRTDLLGPREATNPLETSASALFVAALQRAHAAGLRTPTPGDVERLARARAALREQVVWREGHPVLVGTSTGTDPLWSAAYRAVSADENVGHGVGAVLLALSGPR